MLGIFGPPRICRWCRWWEQHGPRENQEGFCRLMGFTNLGSHINEFAKVKTRDSYRSADGTYQAGPACWAKHDEVRTSPNFGCNQWEEVK